MKRLMNAWARAREWLKEHSRHFTCVAFLAILTAYAAVEAAHFTPAYLEVDPDGYLILAKRIARGGPLAVQDDDIFYYQSHVWVENQQGRILPKFAPGYSAIMAVFYLVGGDEAMFLVSPVCGLLALVGVFFLFRLWMSRIAALMGVLFLASNKMFLIYTGFMLTHGLDICVVVWSMYFLFKWLRDGRLRFAIPAGLLIGFACAVRYANCSLSIVVLIAVVGRFASFCGDIMRRRRNCAVPEPTGRSEKKIDGLLMPTAGLLICCSIFPILIGLYNQTLFGNPLTTGYSLSNEQTAFSQQQFLLNYRAIVSGLDQEGLFPVFQAGAIAMLALGPWTEGLMRIFWFLPLFLMHSSYYWAGGQMALIRFFISTFPVFIGATFAVLDKLSMSMARKIAAMTVLMALVSAFRYEETKRTFEHYVSSPPARSLVATCRVLSGALKEDAVIFSRWPDSNYLGTRRNFRLYNLEDFTSNCGWESARGHGPRQQEKRFNRLRNFYATHNSAQLQELKRDLTRHFLSEGRQVAFLIPRRSESQESDQLGPDFEFTLLQELKPNPRGNSQSGQWGLFEVKANR